MHSDLDNVGISLIVITAATCVALLVWIVRHNTGSAPLSRRTRNLLMWLALVELLAMMFWQAKHGNFAFLF
jgi:hypothetical protein